MKRAAVGALLISLVAGSTAMAGTVLAPAYYEKYGDRHGGQQQVDNRHGGENRQGDNRGGDRGGDRGRDHRDDRRDNGRHDNNWNNRDDHRNDRRWDNHRDDHRNDGRHDDHRWNDGRRDWNDHRFDDRRSYDGRRYDNRWNDGRRYDPPRHYDPPRFSSRPSYEGRRWENGRWHWGSYYRPHGYYVRHWARGDRLPVAYYGPTYIVSDYYDCGLRAPPYGYHWVRVDHDVILAAIATGLVLDVVYNQFW